MNVADVEKAYNNGGLVGGVYAYSVDDDVYTLRPILDMDDQADRENQNSLYKNYKDVASNVTGAGARSSMTRLHHRRWQDLYCGRGHCLC